jgi:hypothetical protein
MTLYFDEAKLWPRRRLNLICGASGAGKTTWILPQLISLHKLGVEVIYIPADRTVTDAKETLTDLGFREDALPIYSFQNESSELKVNVDGLRQLIQAHRFVSKRDVELVLVESICIFPKDMNSAKDVVDFGRELNGYMEISGVSVWGTSWCPKTREGERFIRTRDNVMGSAAWPGIAGTIAYIEATEPGSIERKIIIMPRRGPEQTEFWRFTPAGVMERFEKATPDALVARGGTITRDDLTSIGLTEQQATRWFRKKLAEGVVEFVRKGTYLVVSK